MPNAGRAVVDLAKLLDYCLSTDHPRGRHKARVFQLVLGFTSAEADELVTLLMIAARNDEAVPGEHDDYGQRYTVDFLVTGPRGQANVRSA